MLILWIKIIIKCPWLVFTSFLYECIHTSHVHLYIVCEGFWIKGIFKKDLIKSSCWTCTVQQHFSNCGSSWHVCCRSLNLGPHDMIHSRKGNELFWKLYLPIFLNNNITMTTIFVLIGWNFKLGVILPGTNDVCEVLSKDSAVYFDQAKSLLHWQSWDNMFCNFDN